MSVLCTPNLLQLVILRSSLQIPGTRTGSTLGPQSNSRPPAKNKCERLHCEVGALATFERRDQDQVLEDTIRAILTYYSSRG
ncbi:hypothetical protein PC121_g5884 [Phytophthora cactorum]|nr:hypothetical protein PC120_g1874 [Phytophthora cactorum]KAG3083003.1 hypothetical protein PC121_g5884 [Phytophthora cactorum]